jgi:DNA-binding transcriptional regulator YbjK
MAEGAARRNDPERRQRIVAAALDVIADRGVSNTTHRRIAAAAGVPLGSVTYYFETLEALLTEAFVQLAEEASDAFRAKLAAATDRDSAREAVIDIISGSVWAEPRTLLLSYELYAFAARHPPVAAIMRRWMNNSRAALERFFDPLTARGLDAFVEGIGIHNSIDLRPLDRAAISDLVARVTNRQLLSEADVHDG